MAQANDCLDFRSLGFEFHNRVRRDNTEFEYISQAAKMDFIVISLSGVILVGFKIAIKLGLKFTWNGVYRKHERSCLEQMNVVKCLVIKRIIHFSKIVSLLR